MTWLTTPWPLLIRTIHIRHLGSERGPVGKQRDLRRVNPFVGWYLLLQVSFCYTSHWLWLNILFMDEGYTYCKNTHYTLNLFILINSSLNNAGSSSEYKYHTVGWWVPWKACRSDYSLIRGIISLLPGTEENHKNLQSCYSVLWPRFKPDT